MVVITSRAGKVEGNNKHLNLLPPSILNYTQPSPLSPLNHLNARLTTMPWPLSRAQTDDQTADDWRTRLTTTFSRPEVLASSVLLTAASLGAIRFYKRNLRRIPTADHIPPHWLRERTVFGQVTSVGDGDNFRVFHTPGGRLAGWGWMPGRKVPATREELRDNTIHVRLAGIDAPELAHFGKPAQPYGREALDWLSAYVLGRRVRVQLWRKDQYSRVVGTVFIRRGVLGWLMRKDVGLEMLKAGMAGMYEAKFGAEFGGRENMYKEAEEKARKGRVGMWVEESVWRRLMGAKKLESPREYKTRTKDIGDKV
ncbi:SNase-domain-containing protein [Microthyrium microscopicum]|uniref:Probable endonuclease LCL3 n=1 Tax=Microthyrium microscopicum TaxID=703497 RepID=A0A6A6UWF6_9PEZI|nr:SNase-domain-containing protein [Microthyrium microscopicum]